MGASKSKPAVDFQQIVDCIPQTITVLDARGTIIYANQEVLDYTGLTVADVMRPDFRDRVFHPEDVAQLSEERQQALLRGKPFENEQRARGKDGTYRWFLIRYKPLLDENGRPLRCRISGPAGAAARLGIPRQTLDSRIKTLAIDKYRFRNR